MNQLTSSSTSLNKLKTVFLLGLTCNLTTFAGCTAVWIILAKNEWVSGFWQTLFTVMFFAPVFMGDAINHYTLGRIRIEQLNGWDDVQITPAGRESVTRFYRFFRILSILPAYLLAASIVAGFGTQPEIVIQLKTVFLLAFALNFFRSTMFLKNYIAPRLPSYGGRPLAIRSFITGGIFALWFVYFFNIPAQAMSKMGILGNGMLFFFLNGLMNPLPTKYSLLRPGKIASKAAFFTIEVLTDEQLSIQPMVGEIEAVASQMSELKMKLTGNIRMPLLELPLFQAWGKIFMDEKNQTMAMILGTEVKNSTHITILSPTTDGWHISTNFGAPKARFPQNFIYRSYDKSELPAKLLKSHADNLPACDKTFENPPWSQLESAIKSIIKHLETEAMRNKKSDTIVPAKPAASTEPCIQTQENK